jgi:uncharacterized protein (DUF2235 family)
MQTPSVDLPARRGRNIVILSDGTGQRGGVYFDEARTNVYKLFRACRSAPDSCVSPEQQLAFYDPGLGTLPEGGGTLSRVWRRFYNLVSQATGLGITRNIIDCYAALIELWQPGDRIFLFGFSRGAYTVRCLGTALCLCGIPTQRANGKPLKRDPASAKALAAIAVKTVYQHVSSPRDEQFVGQRRALAAKFRSRYQSSSDDSAYPFFIGVFDTVAALTNYGSLGLLAGIYAVGWLALSSGLAWLFGESVAHWAAWLLFDTFCLAVAAYVYTHLKFSFSLRDYHWWETVHLTTFRQRFYDQELNERVKYARHAISIDERRADFARVRWGDPRSFIAGERMPRFRQWWFAGNHADIGGGYPENESRLSDIALQWMIESASDGLGEQGLIVDRSVLRLSPSPTGMQHDETRSLAFRLAGKTERTPVPDAPLHPSVSERFHHEPGVQQYDVVSPYRPEALRNHKEFPNAYDDIPLPRQTCAQLIRACIRAWRHARRTSERTRADRFFLLMRGWRMDRFVSCLSLIIMLALVAAGVGLLGYQVLEWLRADAWHSMPLDILLSCIRNWGADWLGLQRVYDWILALPLSLMLILFGLFLFGAGGWLSSYLYRHAALAQQKPVTPAQTRA